MRAISLWPVVVVDWGLAGLAAIPYWAGRCLTEHKYFDDSLYAFADPWFGVAIVLQVLLLAPLVVARRRDLFTKMVLFGGIFMAGYWACMMFALLAWHWTHTCRIVGL